MKFKSWKRVFSGILAAVTVISSCTAGPVMAASEETETGYPTLQNVLPNVNRYWNEEKLTDAEFCEDVCVYDANLITSQGPATPYPFAFQILEALGVDPAPLKERLLYRLAGGK